MLACSRNGKVSLHLKKDGFGREVAGEEAAGGLEGVPMPGLPPHGGSLTSSSQAWRFRLPWQESGEQPHIVQPPFNKELGLSRNSRHLPPGSVKALHRAWLKW